MARNVRKATRNAKSVTRKRKLAPDFRKGSRVAKVYAALQKGTTIDKLIRLTGWTEGTVRSYFPMFRDKYGVNITREGTRGESTYYAD